MSDWPSFSTSSSIFDIVTTFYFIHSDWDIVISHYDFICIFLMATLATSCKELTRWKRLWCWEGLGAGGERDDRGWDGWMASLTWWTWVWDNSGSWWWTGRPGVLRFMRSQRVGYNWVTDLIWSDLDWFSMSIKHLLSDPAPCISFCPGHSFPLPISLTSWHSWLIYFLHALS